MDLSRTQMARFILIAITIIAMHVTSQAAVIATEKGIPAVSRNKIRLNMRPIVKAIIRCTRNGATGETELFKCVGRRVSSSVRRCLSNPWTKAVGLKACYDFRTEHAGGEALWLYYHKCLGISYC